MIRQVAAPWAQAMAPGRKYAGLVRNMWSWRRGPWHFVKVAAHVTDAATVAALVGPARQHRRGNDAADEAAKGQC